MVASLSWETGKRLERPSRGVWGPVLQTGFLCLRTYVRGAVPRGSKGLERAFSSDYGDLQWNWPHGNTCLCTEQGAPAGTNGITSTNFQYRVDPGLISPWTSLYFPHPVVTLWYSRWWTGSANLPILCHCPRLPRPRKQPNLSSSVCSVSTVSQ